ncbi:MAG: LysM peptidoglycan-binding domain-containing protein [Candidatus Levybacteria bacterium]|nr:LysM peptidoglycan-binding domain-containing protein [Candidatus Levybacteria bacterium]
MAVKKTGRKTVSGRKSDGQEAPGGILSYFRFGESYTSLILGIVVVIISTILLVSFIRNYNIAKLGNQQPDISATKTENVNQQSKPGGSYIVQEGDDLWTIAEKIYNDGYQWEAIAKANNLSAPNELAAGKTLQLPRVKAKPQPTTIATVSVAPTKAAEPSGTIEPKSTTQPSAIPTIQVSPQQKKENIAGTKYTIREGDTLWDIAVRSYGDGFKWVEIYRANATMISNPDLIYTGSTISVPK